MYWNGFLSTLNFIIVSFGPFFAPTHTMEPGLINNLGESPAVPSLNKLIWTSSHCQNLVGEMKNFNKPTIPSVVNVNDPRSHNHSRKQNHSNKNRMKKQHRIENPDHPSSRTTNDLASKSNDVIPPTNKKLNPSNKNNKNNPSENPEPSDQKRSRKRVNNDPTKEQTMESIDEEGDIGAVFETPDTPHGLISEYDTSDLSKLKERFNYASIDCGANVLKANKEAKGTSAILSESKDSYVLNKCSAEKYVIVELCYPILVDTIVLANFEFFSSTFKNIRASISKWYPPKEDWKVIGEYRAKNSRELQIFNVKAPIMFAKYLRIDFQQHYGNHHYCPVSLLRVHGNSETDMWNKEQEEDGIASSSSQVESQSNVETNDDTSETSLPSGQLTEEDLDKLSEDIQIDSKHPDFKVENDKSLRKQSRAEQSDEMTKLNHRNVDFVESLVKTKNVLEQGVCPTNDPLNRRDLFPIKIHQEDSLLICPRICYTDRCPIIITESDLSSENLSEIIVPINKLPKNGKVVKKSPPVQSKQNKTDPNGGPNQSTFMFLLKRIITLESNSKRSIESLKEVFGKVDSQSEKLVSIVDHFSGTVENLKNQYEQLLKTTFSEFHTNQSKFDEELKDLTSNVHLLVSEIVFLKRLLLFSFLSFLIYICRTHDWVNVRRSLLDLHAAMNARASVPKLIDIQDKHINDIFDDVKNIYSDNEQ